MNPAPHLATVPAPFQLRDAERFVRQSLEDATEQGAIAAIRMPAPHAPLHVMLRCLRKADAMTFRSPDGAASVAYGATLTIALDGPNRFATLREQSTAIFAQLRRYTQHDVQDRAPRLVGGFSFDVGSASAEPWTDLGDGRFLLPRWEYCHEANQTTLTLCVDCRRPWDGRFQMIRAELQHLWQLLGKRRTSLPTHTPQVRIKHANRETWEDQVRQLTARFDEQALHKVVLTRRSLVSADTDLDPWAVLDRLDDRYPATWRFGLRLGQTTFVAATPERLFTKHRNKLIADALAGSISSASPDAAASLLQSTKDRREHQLVIDHLKDRLAPFAKRIALPKTPEIRSLPNVLHLHTKIEALLHRHVHAADIAAAIHPTPAVGGTPSNAALDWIRQHEPNQRGWYCGAVGWIDADGDAELTVALRCGIIRGANAWIYAGGGIVEGSKPSAEWDESALKLRPLLYALGAVP